MTCKDCFFLSGDNYCHRTPPIAWQDQATPNHAMFTKVNPDVDWCGEYREKAVKTYETKVVTNVRAKKVQACMDV